MSDAIAVSGGHGARSVDAEPDSDAGAFGGAPFPPGEGEEWLLQAQAAEVVGCSVSAIRKWRREGSVSARRLRTPGGMERVEVRLTDVQARAGQVRVNRPAVAGAAPVPSGMVMIPMADLEALFRQVTDAERRARESERKTNELRRLRDELAQTKALLSRTTADLAEQHRRERLRPPPADATRRESGPRAGSSAVGSAPATGRARLPGGDEQPGKLTVAPKRPTRADFPERPVGGASSAPSSRPGDRENNLPALAQELRRLYRRLQAHHSAGPGNEAESRRWTEELTAYDKALVTACRFLGVATRSRPGGSLHAAERIELTRQLASAGLDVRVKPLNSSM